MKNYYLLFWVLFVSTPSWASASCPYESPGSIFKTVAVDGSVPSQCDLIADSLPNHVQLVSCEDMAPTDSAYHSMARVELINTQSNAECAPIIVGEYLTTVANLHGEPESSATVMTVAQ